MSKTSEDVVMVVRYIHLPYQLVHIINIITRLTESHSCHGVLDVTCGMSVVFSGYYCRRFLCHDVTEILLKVTLHSHYLTQVIKYFICYFVDESKYFILKTAKQTHRNKKIFVDIKGGIRSDKSKDR